MDKKIHAIFTAIILYAEGECQIWMDRVPKTHTNAELVNAAKMTRRIKKAKQWLKENDPWQKKF